MSRNIKSKAKMFSVTTKFKFQLGYVPVILGKLPNLKNFVPSIIKHVTVPMLSHRVITRIK